ncbi:MAG: hypothetical protein RL417_860 [Pseudomonadota bacterium]|jgi:uncharacterized membrane protein YdcZ (DUF606 family)
MVFVVAAILAFGVGLVCFLIVHLLWRESEH